MGIGAARVGDTGSGTCCGHPPIPCIAMQGQIVNGSGSALCNGLGMGLIGSIVIGDCGHTGVIISGSTTVITEGIGNAQIGSVFTGTFFGTIINGSDNVLVGG